VPLALIVDNDTENTLLLSEIFREHGYAVQTADTVSKAREAMLRRMPEIAMLNDRINGDDTLKLLESVDLGPVMDIYLMSEDPTVKVATGAIRVGASDFFRKPVDRDRLVQNLKDLTDELARESREASAEKNGRGLLVGESRSMQRLYRLIRKCATSSASILLAGESGTGKELVARTIHQLSDRGRSEFVPMNCSALAPELLESELFGHKKGSFTGATRDHQGYFQRASGGTLFLDEITEMNAGLQAKLLRVLESNEVRPVGGDKDIMVDARIITATNMNPEEAVERGRLREDLYYRLAQFPIQVPTLRERGEDILQLAEHFLKQCNAQTGVEKKFDENVEEALRLHDWPGNVRELRNAILHGHLLAGAIIRIEDLPGQVSSTSPGDDDFIRLTVGTPLAEVERRAILSTLGHYDGDKKKAAEVLGISLKTLYNRLKKYKESG
jgi:two-component system, NtrC family, response regulator AtoC